MESNEKIETHENYESKYKLLLEENTKLQGRLKNYTNIQQELISANYIIDKQLDSYKKLNYYIKKIVESESLERFKNIILEVLVDVFSVESSMVVFIDNNQKSYYTEGLEKKEFNLDAIFTDIERITLNNDVKKPIYLNQNQIKEHPALGNFQRILLRKFKSKADGYKFFIVGFVSKKRSFNYDKLNSEELLMFDNFSEQMHSILKHRMTRNTLLTEKEKYGNIIANMNLGLLEVDNNENILMLNQSFSKMSGYTINELIGKSASETLLNIKGRHKMAKHNALRQQNKSSVYEMEVITKQNKKQTWLISGAPNYNSNGDVIGSIGIHLDITEQKRLETQKEKLLKQLKRSNEELEEYAHIVSHDLKSPLRNVSALASWIKSDNIDNLKVESVEHFEHLELTLEKMESLISGVLEFASVAENSKDIEKTNLQELIKDLIRTLHIPKHIHIKIKKQLPIVKGDAVKLLQIFQNIISNAIEYIDKPKGLIVIDYIEKKYEYEFSISDNGMGIDEKYFEKIFKIFNSLHKNRKHSGVGLSIVKKILDLYNCTINIKSTLGEGTTVYFTLKK